MQNLIKTEIEIMGMLHSVPVRDGCGPQYSSKGDWYIQQVNKWKAHMCDSCAVRHKATKPARQHSYLIRGGGRQGELSAGLASDLSHPVVWCHLSHGQCELP